MKINITDTQRKQLTDFRGQLAAVLENLNTGNSELNRLTKKQAKLEQEIAKLEASESEADAAALSTKRTLLEQVVKKISEMEVDPSAAERNDSKNLELLRTFARFAAATTGPTIESYGRAIAAKIRDYFQSDTDAFHGINRVPAYFNLVQTYTYPFGGYGNANANELTRAIARIDEILSGELNWSWDSKQKA